jgi:hypothetical protein
LFLLSHAQCNKLKTKLLFIKIISKLNPIHDTYLKPIDGQRIRKERKRHHYNLLNPAKSRGSKERNQIE